MDSILSIFEKYFDLKNKNINDSFFEISDSLLKFQVIDVKNQLFNYLSSENIRIRILALKLINHLFLTSGLFRHEISMNLPNIYENCILMNPKPKLVNNKQIENLKTIATSIISEWNSKYQNDYIQIKALYNLVIKKCNLRCYQNKLKINPTDDKSNISRISQEFNKNNPVISKDITRARSLISKLVPCFTIPISFGASNFNECQTSGSRFSINRKVTVIVDESNELILKDLKTSILRFQQIHIPFLKKCISALTSCVPNSILTEIQSLCSEINQIISQYHEMILTPKDSIETSQNLEIFEPVPIINEDDLLKDRELCEKIFKPNI